MAAARQAARLQKELQMMQSDPPPGACVWPPHDTLTHLHAQIQGPDGTVYSSGMFVLDIQIPDRYPFEPPSVRFRTPIYHPNIDNGGRICLDLLHMPPKGSWKPSLNIATLLLSIRLLLSEPNPDDGLMTEITDEYKHNRPAFDLKARQFTEKYAVPGSEASGTDRPRDPADPAPEVGRGVETASSLLQAPRKLSLSIQSACTERAESSKLAQLAEEQVMRRGRRLSLSKAVESARSSEREADATDHLIVADSESEDEAPNSRPGIIQNRLALKRKADT